MTRIDELQKKYPTIPRDILVKFEVWDRGVRYTRDLDGASDWTPTGVTYQTKYDDQNLQQQVAEQPHRLKDGYFLRPRQFMLKSGVGSFIYLNTTSPYTVREIAEGKFAIFEGEEKVDDIYFLMPPKRNEGPGPGVTSKGALLKRFMISERSCFFINTGRHCEYFTLGKQCKFCNFNPSQEDGRAIGLNRPVMETVDDVVEVLRIRSSEVRLLEGRSDMGGFMDSEAETKVYSGWMERAFGAMSYKPNMTVHSEAASRKQLQRLKDAGLDSYAFHIEMWDPLLFPEVCPGKAQHAPYEAWMEAMANGLEIFGEGNVSVRTICGLSLIPENGHKTWQEARDSHAEFVRSMVKMGVLPAWGPLAMPPGSVYGTDLSLQEKLPPTDYQFDLMLVQHEAMREHGMYDRINKFMWCGLDCTRNGPYTVDLEVLTHYGDYGNWMADVVPEESNWLRKFLKSVGADAPAPGAAEGGQ